MADECASIPDEAAVLARLRELVAESPELGYRAAHTALQKEPLFKDVGLKRVQKILRDLREQPARAPQEVVAVAGVAAGPNGVSPPPIWNGADAVAVSASTRVVNGSDAAREGTTYVTLERPDMNFKFGMMIATEPSSAANGHAVTEIREGGVVAAWNATHPESAIGLGDVIVAVNGKSGFDSIMEEFRERLTCELQVQRNVLREDNSEAMKETAAWEARKARVTAALIPGLKKIVESEFGDGAGNRIGRVEEMYLRVGRNEVFEEDGPLGKRYSPGYIEGLSPIRPFHDTKDYPFCAELRCQWKAIRKELRGCLDESLWTPGAYQASNQAYGSDWRIMGVLTSDRWQDEQRFRVTTNAVKQLRGITPFEVFFARMPPHTKISPHSDNLSYILTSHLALDLEEGACSITVGNEEKYWKEGEMLVLDTTFIHSTKNESARHRYVLVLRFWHPGLTTEERRAIHVSHAILAGASGQ